MIDMIMNILAYCIGGYLGYQLYQWEKRKKLAEQK